MKVDFFSFFWPTERMTVKKRSSSKAVSRKDFKGWKKDWACAAMNKQKFYGLRQGRRLRKGKGGKTEKENE